MWKKIVTGVLSFAFLATAQNLDVRPRWFSGAEYACYQKKEMVQKICPRPSKLTLACCDSVDFLRAVSDACPWVRDSTYGGVSTLLEVVVFRRSFLTHCNEIRYRWAVVNYDVHAQPLAFGGRNSSVRELVHRLGADQPSIGSHSPQRHGIRYEEWERLYGGIVGTVGPISQAYRVRAERTHPARTGLQTNRPVITIPIPAGR